MLVNRYTVSFDYSLYTKSNIIGGNNNKEWLKMDNKQYVSPSHKNRRSVQIYKNVDDVANELKFDLRVNSKQEVYTKAIELLYKSVKGEEINLSQNQNGK
nr:hypothetical protein [Staphylococcus pseudintermedius]